MKLNNHKNRVFARLKLYYLEFCKSYDVCVFGYSLYTIVDIFWEILNEQQNKKKQPEKGSTTDNLLLLLLVICAKFIAGDESSTQKH